LSVESPYLMAQIPIFHGSAAACFFVESPIEKFAKEIACFSYFYIYISP
jgi:hypothetical protein